MTTDPMAEIRASFFVECDDLLEGMHDALTLVAADDGDAEAVNTVFRAVHSIKGGGAAFGLDALVAYAHRLESALDQLRAGRIHATAEVVGLLFRSADALQDHVRAARAGLTPPAEADPILRAIEALLPAPVLAEDAPAPFTPTPLALCFDEGEDAPDFDADSPDASTAGSLRHWRISFTPAPALYTSGNEALLLLRALCALGEATVACDIPEDLSLADAEAERPRLSWRVGLEADVERAELDEVFDFVADVCKIEIAEAPRAPRAISSPEHMQPAPSTTAALSPAAEDAGRTFAPEAGLACAVPPQAEAGATVRVDLQKVDRLMNLVGELVINQAMLSQSVGLAGLDNAEVAAGLDAFLALTRDIQDSVMSVRAQPVKPLFQRMARVVREASSVLGKEVRLTTEGDATEVDKTVTERLAEPLTHMIRNAVDHGLETPDQRLAAGKPREGRIILSAEHRAGRIIIGVTDDGAGIDRGKVLGLARSRGLIALDAAPSEAEIDRLLFLPGFSTSDGVSALSGRGVGMDVVRSALAALGGRMSIASEPGRGTSFSISLPLTLAVLDGMVIQAAGQSFVIPLSSIIETAALAPGAIKRIGGATELLHIRGELIPLIDLGARLGFRPAAAINRNGIVLLTALDSGGRAALAVDAIMEQRQVVIKGLGPGFGRMPGVAGATILGDGRIALILDPADLVQKTRPPAPDLALAG